MGLRVEVYTSRLSRDYNTSNDGLSARFTEVTVVNAEGPYEPTDDAPGVRLEPGPLGTIRAVPVDGGGSEKPCGPMFGGAYIATSDSRFGDAVAQVLGRRLYGAIALHDRYESAELARAMSL